MISIFEVTAAVNHLSLLIDSEKDNEAIEILENFIKQYKERRPLHFKSANPHVVINSSKLYDIEKSGIEIPDSIYSDIEYAKYKRYNGMDLEKQMDYANGQCDTIDSIKKYNNILKIKNKLKKE